MEGCTDFLMSSLNSQYAASMVSGSAQTPLVQVLSSTLGRPRYRKFPAAMAMRYGGMGIGCTDFVRECTPSRDKDRRKPACTRRSPDPCQYPSHRERGHQKEGKHGWRRAARGGQRQPSRYMSKGSFKAKKKKGE